MPESCLKGKVRRQITTSSRSWAVPAAVSTAAASLSSRVISATRWISAALRAKVLYDSDEANTIRKSHENTAIKELYATYLGEPGSEKAHHLLHTSYVKRSINQH